MLSAHRQDAKQMVKCGVITISDTRTIDTDKSGAFIKELLQTAGHNVMQYEIVQDETLFIQQKVKEMTVNKEIEAIIMNGGTGISNRDVTIEAIQPLFSKELPGFGELFRMLSYQLDIGSASIMSRAIAGVINNCIVFSIPGSVKAVKLAMEKLILPELGHAVGELAKDRV
ncbi:MogA/MoaB family molybdenum cofactor biosynthesis protein [Ornithinibacillus scapharcae]|uniref:MogA/MoaB family molybdenum cofactor biosynthesis protein n=1 Tax=Ornithinibacillus scapharcae TaxID=1147159 RepID=UPI000225B6C1|nr:MogA/MoaB family molybdenum cofactor biosynthesis protein [Ornithinibacillus scapharcae]